MCRVDTERDAHVCPPLQGGLRHLSLDLAMLIKSEDDGKLLLVGKVNCFRDRR